MSRRKEVVFYNNRYKGALLSDKNCEILEKLIKISDDNGCIDDLRGLIYDLTPLSVQQIIESKSNDLVELPKGELRDSQTVGVAFMYYAKRLILGDSVGLGKTAQVCGLCNLLESQANKENMDFRFLLITEKALVEETRKKMIKFTGNYVECLYGEKDKIQKFEKYWEGDLPPNIVGTHSLIKSAYFQDYVRGFIQDNGYNPFDIFIIDEAGEILTNSTTQAYKSAKYFANIFDRIIMMNATSFEKELEHFYNQINFLDPTLLPTKEEFDKKYKEFTYGVMRYPVWQGKYKNQKDFQHLIAYRYLKRTRRSLGAKMIDCSAEVVLSDLSKEQKYLKNRVSIPAMVYDCPSYFNNLAEEPIYTNQETTPKLRDLVGLVEKLNGDGPILVFSRFKEAQRCIQDELIDLDYRCEIMNGDTNQKTRENLINSFKLGDIDVLVTNVQKGLDFGNCNNCIFYDYDSNPNKMIQFEGRMTRDYDIIGKHVYLLISRGDELRTFKKTIADRAKASDVFSGSDYSCVLSILLEKDKLKELK